MPNMMNPAVRKLIAQRKAVWAVVPDGRTELLVEPRKHTVILIGGKPITRRKTPNPSTARDYRTEFAEHAKAFEDFVGHMYLDIRGNVTVGYGHHLRHVGMGETIGGSFHLPELAVATGVDLDRAIIEDFERLADQAPENRLASAYESETTARMDESGAWEILQDDIDDAISTATGGFPGWATFPSGAKLGVLNMVFNVGLRRMKSTDPDIPGFPNFIEAVRLRDWRTAVRESHRLGIDEQRNQAVFEWSNMYAAREEPDWVDPR